MNSNRDPFHPQSNISCGQFVALSVLREEVDAGVPIYVGKVIDQDMSRRRMKIKVCWYWPIMRGAVVDELGSIARRYANCIDPLWEPIEEHHSWVEKEACIFPWVDEPENRTNGAIRW